MPIQNAYDSVPYSSYPYPQSAPSHLYTLAKLFGISAPDFSKARILELGCASGGNIIPLAVQYPDCHIVGIDLSEAQIKEGRRHAEALELTNIELKHLSILDVEASLGQFDYIIAHGILSWVPETVQNKIFEICQKNLAPMGVAYVSYNTLPGWNMIKSIRDMMLYHTQNLPTPLEKATQAKLLLTFLSEHAQDKEGPYGKLLAQETALLAQVEHQYLLHDHMEQDNHAFYFYEFMQKATTNKLQYLADSNIASMFVGNFSTPIIELFKSISNDIVRTEQYLDFLTNRRFRATLLCHDTIPLNRALNPDMLEDFYLTTVLATVAPITDIIPGQEYEFVGNNQSFKTNNPAIIQMFLILREHGRPLLGSELVQKTLALLKAGSFNPDVVRTEMLSMALRLLLANLMQAHPEEGRYTIQVSDKPKISALAQYQASLNNWVTSQAHQKTNIDLFCRFLFRYLDGNHSLDELRDKMVAHFESGELLLHMDGKLVSDKKLIKKHVKNSIEHLLKTLAPQGVLVE